MQPRGRCWGSIATQAMPFGVSLQRYPHLRLCMQVDDVDFALREDPYFGEFVAR